MRDKAMSTTFDRLELFERSIEQIKRLHQGEVDQAYKDGFAAGLATTPNHKLFHSQHQKPQWYGEDGDIVAVSGEYSRDDAVALITAFLKAETGEVDDVEGCVNREKAIPGTNDDGYDYFIRNDGTGIFDAWVWGV